VHSFSKPYLEIEYSTTYVGWYGGRGLYWKEYAWVCLSDPGNNKIPAFSPMPKPAAWSPDGNYEWLFDDGYISYSIPKYDVYNAYDDTFPMHHVIIILSALVIVTAASIVVFRRSKKTGLGKESGEKE